jgi:HD-GYP domain-containing protein (c-di-GMP phosphodiesterase class II)
VTLNELLEENEIWLVGLLGHTPNLRRWAAQAADFWGLGLDFELAALYHDYGRLFVPGRPDLRQRPLTQEEQEAMKTHVVIGYRKLAALGRVGLEAVLYHHERWDGQGYLYGLSGQEIPLAGRVCAVLDALDAMLAERPYRPARSWVEALGELEAGSGSQFDPAVVQWALASLRLEGVCRG